jgi:hypothetical protein
LPATVASLFFCFSSFSSLAADYEVNYAVDMRGEVESEGSVECSYGTSCWFESKKSHIFVALRFNISPRRRFSVSIYGAEAGCCYFSNGDGTADINVYNNKYAKLDIFEGRGRKGNELILNNKIGTLLLSFKYFR